METTGFQARLPNAGNMRATFMTRECASLLKVVVVEREDGLR